MYICRVGLLLLFFSQVFQMAFSSLQMSVILGFFATWLHKMLSVLTSVV